MAYSETLVFEDVPAPTESVAATFIALLPIPPSMVPKLKYVTGTADVYGLIKGREEYVVDAPGERFTVKET